MGVDRIGNKGPPVPSVGSAGGARAAETASPFTTTGASAAPPTAAVSASAALQRLQSGQIDLAGYVDLKVQEATAHLSGLPPVQLEALREALRERMANDPTLVDLVGTASGGLARATSDD
jgi:hypothetical protein